MHPQLFLKTFWQMELRPQIFVAMSFDPTYKSRFDDVIAPAIRAISVNGVALDAYRVDLSRTGDSILTDIMDGIAHSQMVLADVSSIGKDSKTGKSYRSGNVMYEVGLTLACRQSSEILLVRDDQDQFLFDVSTIPHMTLDFTDANRARNALQDALVQRLKERKHINDARVQLTIASLSNDEITILKKFNDFPENSAVGWENLGFWGMTSLPRLLDKQLIKLVALFEAGHPAYILSPLGRVVVQTLNDNLQKVKPDPQLTDAGTDLTK